ncbi:Eco57I restriction-modification methylase domain-containing protein [Nocardiopsis alborubida]|uniref:site-specific DNA-methyltransferase (adenine-specific) n=1 Tax=Nocardiopsis alborubida TaxID=146802 RepID=A0A7X6MGC4_9ACTN|nr:DNA methyltransferase [Nocardiopsis alborubida]NKY99994.1 N-6 DNA methylase [Nocardiopsis alborubida]
MSAIARNQVLTAVHTVGGLLPTDMLARIAEGKDVAGSKPADYGVIGARSVSDEAERHWDYLKGGWRELRKQLPTDTEGRPAVDSVNAALSQWVEPLFNLLGFGRLPAGPGEGIASDDKNKTFKVSHLWQHVPVHVVNWHADLDKRPGGAGTVPPQSHVQEMLNSTSTHLWAVVTNGRQVRLLRDSSALATAAYVEFDLEAIFDGELFSEFVLLYRLLHASRFEVKPDEAPSACWLEKWRADAITSGTRALEQLSGNVREAITVLGTGFLRHPENTELRANLDVKEFHGALLRLVYRMLFLFVAEDRDALHPPTADEQARERYAKYFSSARLRRHARRRRGTSHGDQYEALRLVLDALGDVNGRPELGIPALGGLFTDTEADAPLRGLKLSNEALCGAVRNLAQVRDPDSKRWRSVDYRNLDAEELGSIYESLLELVPKHSDADRSFQLFEVGGNDRKTTGSYYTPSSLIETLLDSALDPVIDDAFKRGHEKASKAGEPDSTEAVTAELLKLTVCDPACGSGHFLVAAARRIAKKVAAVREGNPEPTVDAVRSAMHEVVARCIYGVDLNPMAVELVKVSLWLEALEPGKPLNFLDAHVKHGNALIGVTPSLLKGGIPDEAFKPIEGDDKKYARFLAKTNKAERGGQLGLFDIQSDAAGVTNTALAENLRQITAVVGDSLDQVRNQEAAYRGWIDSDEYVRNRRVADAWCSAFVWKKAQDAPRAVTQEVLHKIANAQGNGAPFTTIEEIDRLRGQYRFFHWHLEFPDVFSAPEDGGGVDKATGWAGGFDCMLGNPPWERIKLQEQEFFAQRDVEIATAPNAAARKALIADLKKNPDRSGLYQEFEEAKRKAEGESHFLRISGRYPLTGRGDINTYAVFSETDRTLVGPRGRMGVIVPTGIATDATTQYFFKDLVQAGSIAALYDFENAAPLFPGVHRSFKFCILSLTGRDMHESKASFAFFVHDPAELEDANKAFTMTPEEITLLNPNTGTCPVFRSRRDAEITLDIYKRVPVLVKEGDPDGNPWGVSFMTMFHMSNDSHLFHTREDLEDDGWRLEGNIFTKGSKRMLPLYESKMIHHYDHRWATYVENGSTRDFTLEEKRNSSAVVLPRYWVSEVATDTGEVDKNGNPIMDPGVQTKLESSRWDRGWLLGWRDICRSTDERTAIIGAFPRSAVGNNLPASILWSDLTESAAGLIASLSSMVFDFCARLKVGGTHLNFFISHQLPVLGFKQTRPYINFIGPRVVELAYTASDMKDFALDLGDEGAPFRWDEERRAIMRAELDALFFHLYGINRDDVDYIMETFPIVKRKDEAKYGTYRTKELILEIYDRMAKAGVSLDTPLIDGENFISMLTPPPGHGPRHAPA